MIVVRTLGRLLVFPLQIIASVLLSSAANVWLLTHVAIGYLVFGDRRHFLEPVAYDDCDRQGNRFTNYYHRPDLSWVRKADKKIWAPKFMPRKSSSPPPVQF